MANAPIVSAIVVSYETRDLTLDAVGSLLAFLPSPSDVWVVDNASADGSAEAVRSRFPSIDVIELGQNVGFGAANNVAMARARGEFFLLLNSDAQLVDTRSVRRMVEHMRADPQLAVVAPRLENADGRLEYSARSFPTLSREVVRRWGLYLVLPRALVGRWLLGDFWAPSSAVRVDWVTAACMLVRREAYYRVGGFDERIFMYGEEQEWARRFARAGWTTLYDPSVRVVHRRAASGAAGPWRVRAALESDVRVFRWTHGPARTGLLNLVRVTGFALEALALRAMDAVRTTEYVRDRRRSASQALREQLGIIRRMPLG